MLTVNCPSLTCVRDACVSPFYFLSSLRDCPVLLTPASLSYHQWILCSPLISPPLILMYKIRCNNCPSPEHFLNPLGFCSQRLSSAWLRKPLIRLFLRLGVLLLTPPQHFLKQGTLHPRIFICMGPRTYAVALADNSHSSLPRVTTLSGGQNLPKMLPHPCCALVSWVFSKSC